MFWTLSRSISLYSNSALVIAVVSVLVCAVVPNASATANWYPTSWPGNAGNSDSLSPYRRRNSISGRRRGNRSAPFGSFLPFGDGRSRVRPRDAEPERGAGTRVKRQRCRTAVAERTEGNRPALRRGIRMPSSTAVTVHNLFRTDDRSRPCCEV